MRRAMIVAGIAIGGCGSAPRPPPPPLSHAGPPGAVTHARLDRAALEHTLRRWRAQWTPVRACLIGEPPHADALGDALEVSALLGSQCSDLVSDLHVPGSQAPTLAAIERAWVELDVAVHYLRYQDTIGHDRGLSAIRDIDDWTAALIRAAHLTDDAPPRGAPLPTLAPAPQLPELRALRPADSERHRWTSSLHDHRVTITGGNAWLEARAADRVIVRTLRDDRDVTRASPGGGWGARPSDGRVLAGVLADRGELRAGAVDVGASGDVLAALGDGDRRVLILAHVKPPTVEVMRSVDGGLRWTTVNRIAGAAPTVQLVNDGVADLVWRSEKAMRWLHVTAELATAKPVDIPRPNETAGSLCAAGDRLWYTGGKGLVHWAEGRRSGSVTLATTDQDDDVDVWHPRLATCSASAVLAVVGRRATRCTPTSCDPLVQIRTAGDDATAVELVDDGLAHARQIGRVVGVWRTTAPPRFVQLERGESLLAIVAWSGTLWLSTMGPQGARFSPLP